MLPAWTQYSSAVEFNIDSAFKQNQCDGGLRVRHIPFDTLTVLVKRRERRQSHWPVHCCQGVSMEGEQRGSILQDSECLANEQVRTLHKYWQRSLPRWYAEMLLSPFAVFQIEVGEYESSNPFCNGQDVEKWVQNVLFSWILPVYFSIVLFTNDFVVVGY